MVMVYGFQRFHHLLHLKPFLMLTGLVTLGIDNQLGVSVSFLVLHTLAGVQTSNTLLPVHPHKLNIGL